MCTIIDIPELIKEARPQDKQLTQKLRKEDRVLKGETEHKRFVNYSEHKMP